MTTRRYRDLVRIDLARGVALLAFAPVLVLGAVVYLAVVITAGPRRRRAVRNAQVAADRLFPGEVRVVRARGLGEAGGYAIDARLLTDEGRDLAWVSDRRCRPGSQGEHRMRAAIATVRDREAERAALGEALRAAGLTVTGDPPVTHVPAFGVHDTPGVTARVTVVVPEADLGGAGSRAVADRLDAATLSWPGRRAALVAEPRHGLDLSLVEGDGTAHSHAVVIVEDGRLRTSAADTLGPVIGPGRRDRLRAALDGPVRAFLREQGLPDADARDLRTTYLPERSERLAVALDVTRWTPVAEGSDAGTHHLLGRVLLVADPDGGDPTDLRFLPS